MVGKGFFLRRVVGLVFKRIIVGNGGLVDGDEGRVLVDGEFVVGIVDLGVIIFVGEVVFRFFGEVIFYGLIVVVDVVVDEIGIFVVIVFVFSNVFFDGYVIRSCWVVVGEDLGVIGFGEVF